MSRRAAAATGWVLLGGWIALAVVAAKRPVPLDARLGTAPVVLAPLPDGRIDVDRATAAELRLLPGIGPALAERIVADRRARGPFGSLDALARVPRIGPATIRDLRGEARAGVPAP